MKPRYLSTKELLIMDRVNVEIAVPHQMIRDADYEAIVSLVESESRKIYRTAKQGGTIVQFTAEGYVIAKCNVDSAILNAGEDFFAGMVLSLTSCSLPVLAHEQLGVSDDEIESGLLKLVSARSGELTKESL